MRATKSRFKFCLATTLRLALALPLLTLQSVAPLVSAQPQPTTSTQTVTPQKNDSNQTPDATQFLHFIAHNQTQTCTADAHALPFNNQIRGVNLGGWLVLEPWITPSLFYQFLGKDENTTAMDIYSFCSVLGPKEGNKQLRR